MSRAAIVTAAEREGATVLRVPGAVILVLADVPVLEHARLPLGEAARVACTSLRVVREAISRGDLPACGGQRDRSVAREDLERWIASRAVKIVGPQNSDIDRRIARLEKGSRR